MTPNHGHDPTKRDVQQPAQSGQQPPRQPPQHGQRPPQGGMPQSPPRQPPQGGTQQFPGGTPGQQSPRPQGGMPQQGGQHPPQPPQAPQGAPPGTAAPPQQGGQAMGGGLQAHGSQGMQAGQRPAGRPRARPTLQPITVDDVVAEDVVTAERDTPVRTIVAQMAERDVGSVVVVDDGEPVGMITDRSVALTLEESPDVSQLTADDLLDGDVVTADTSMNVFDVLQRMSDEGIRRLPVVDDENRLQGIVSLDDILVLLGTELGNAAETIQSQLERL